MGSCSSKRKSLEVVLIDNGSLRPKPYLNLQKICHKLEKKLQNLEKRTKCRVTGVSARHSNKIDIAELNGSKAVILSELLEKWKSDNKITNSSSTDFVFIPFFLGPSKTVKSFISEQIKEFKQTINPQSSAKLLKNLVNEESGYFEINIAKILSKMVLRVKDDLEMYLFREKQKFKDIPIILVDHGTASRDVNLVRRSLAASLRQDTKFQNQVIDCSMENPLEKHLKAEELANKRLNFNFPQLDDIFSLKLGFKPSESQKAIVLYLFLNEGRHAGENGDIDEILKKAKENYPKLDIIKTKVIAAEENHEDLVNFLNLKIKSNC